MTDKEVLRAKLNLDTAKISWSELERYFAAGQLIAVREGVDLVEVALSISSDEKDAVEGWLASCRIGRVTDEEAISWHESKAVLWAVVVKPWVLVQEARTGYVQ